MKLLEPETAKFKRLALKFRTPMYLFQPVNNVADPSTYERICSIHPPIKRLEEAFPSGRARLLAP
eukprot:15469845-Alexandrium_andersonii.AAC.1